MKKQLSFLIALTVFCAIVLFALPSVAIEPPSDRDAERLRNAPDLQDRIDRANALLAPLLNPDNIQLTAFSATFSKGLNKSFGTKEGESGFIDRLDTNADKIIDERDFIELSFLVPQIHRQACSSPKTGDAKCIVLPLKFPDVAPSPSHHSNYWDNMFFGTGTYTTHSYYQQVSAGKLNLGGNVLVDPAQPDGYWMADYPKTTYNDETLLEEILDKADPVYDFSEYDADHNGEADGVFFIYAGETDGWGDFYWGWATYGPWIVDGVRVGPLMFVGENLMTYRVAAHEFGHMMGLPDYYDYTFNSNGVGVWCLMGKGESYMSAKARAYLGWVNPIAISMDTYGVPFMTPRSENGDVWRLWTQGDYGPQYFLLEAVKPTGYDYQIPGEGILVWHVDETVGDNNNWHHKHLDLEEADGLDDIDTKANNGDATDPFYTPNKDTFNHSTYPNSDSYSGANTLVQVLNVSELSTLSADLLIGVPGNLEVDEIEPNNVWNDSGVIPVPAPNSKPDGKVDVYSDLSDYWRVTVAKPSVIDVSLDSYLDGVDLSLYLWSLGGGGPIEVADTTHADEHIRAYVYVPGNHYIEVRAKRQGTYYDLHAHMEYLPDSGEIEIKSVPLFKNTIYDNTMTMPAMRIDILDNAGTVNLNSLQLYTQGDYPSIVQNVSIWLDNGDEIFSPGDDTLIGGPTAVGPSNRIQFKNMTAQVKGYKTLFVVADIGDSGGGGGGDLGLSIQSYKDFVFSAGKVIYRNFPQETGIVHAISAPMPLSYVTAGDFMMGSDPSNDPYYNPVCDYNEETPYHKNRTGNYYISRYEVTNYQFSTFMDDLGYQTQSYWSGGGWSWKNNNNITAPEYWNDGDHYIGTSWPDYPVGGVSWYEAMAYCKYVGGRLPHETEWEKSGRTTDSRIYTYGNVFDDSISALGDPEPVGSYHESDSVYGVSDLSGNIFEWCLDAWEWGLYERYDSGMFDYPTSNSYKMQKGYRYLIVGDCGQDYATRLSFRDTWPRDYRWSVTGFRVAFDPPI